MSKKLIVLGGILFSVIAAQAMENKKPEKNPLDRIEELEKKLERRGSEINVLRQAHVALEDRVERNKHIMAGAIVAFIIYQHCVIL